MQSQIASGLGRLAGVPVTTCSTLEQLTTAAPGVHTVNGVRASDEVVQFTAALPAAIAWWLVTRNPELLRRDRLRLAVLGAGPTEATMYFGLIGPLCGRPDLAVEIDLVGPEATGTPIDCGVDILSVHQATAGDFARGLDHPVDAVFLFHPGFEKHAGDWLIDDDGLKRLCRPGVPVVAASYAKEEYEFDRAYLKACGLSAGEWNPNPFAFNASGEAVEVHTACGLWELQWDGTEPDAAARDERIEALNRASNMAAGFVKTDALAGANRRDMEQAGSRVLLLSESGTDAGHIVLIRGFAVDTTSGRVVRRLGRRASGNIGRVPTALLERAPTPATPYIERVLWVEEVWRTVTLPALWEGDEVSQAHALIGGAEIPTEADLTAVVQTLESAGNRVDRKEILAVLDRR